MPLKKLLGSFVEIETDPIKEAEKRNKKKRGGETDETPKQQVVVQPMEHSGNGNNMFYNPLTNVPGGNSMNIQTTAQTPNVEKFQQHFVELIKNANLDGPDAYEVLEATRNLISLGVPEIQAYQNSFLTLKGMGLTKDKTLSSAEYYLNLLLKDQKEFGDYLQGLIVSDSTEKQKKIENLSTEITNLETKLNELRTELQTTNTDLQRSQQDLSLNKQGYDIAVGQQINYYQQSIEKIKNYIQE